MYKIYYILREKEYSLPFYQALSSVDNHCVSDIPKVGDTINDGARTLHYAPLSVLQADLTVPV